MTSSATVCSNRFIAAPDDVPWSSGDAATPVVRLDHPTGSRLVVALHGAAVLSWRAPWQHADGSVALEELVDGYADAAELAAHDASRSAVMAPFVNRVAGGRYTFGGHEHVLGPVVRGEPVTMHGFVRALDWTVVARMDAASSRDVASLVLRTEVAAGDVAGYPFAVTFEAEYAIGPAGLALTLRATNTGDVAAPVALGWHPYLRVPGHACVDDLELTVPATRAVVTDRDLIPLAGAAAYDVVDGFGPAPLAGVRLDHAFAGLHADPDGRARTVVRDPVTGAGLALWQHGGLVHVYTGDGLARRERAAIALEPVSTLTDAFNRPDCEADLRLDPGATRELRAGVELVGRHALEHPA